MTGEAHKTDKGNADKGRETALCCREVHIGLTPTDGMIPDLEGAVTFDLANDAVRGTDGVVSCLEYRRQLFRDRE